MTPHYMIVEDTTDYVLIRDLGPWDHHMTVTNGAEEVVAELAHLLRGRRLESIDSEGRRDQLLVREGRFAGFAPCPVPSDMSQRTDDPREEKTA